jgi:hypothetical protein
MTIRKKSYRPKQNQPQDEVIELSVYSVEAIQEPLKPRDGASDMEILETACLEICQRQPFGSTPDRKLVSQSNPNERLHMLKLAKEGGIGVEDLVKIIRDSHGIQKDIFQRLNELKSKKKP